MNKPKDNSADRKIGRCKCTHTGDGPDTEHEDQEILGLPVPGHGKCKLCECEMFTWKGWA